MTRRDDNEANEIVAGISNIDIAARSVYGDTGRAIEGRRLSKPV